METTKPFLFIDLEKSWREELHPRDQYGKFTTVKGGSRVVTKTGKTGVVEETTSTHYHVRYDDGKKGKIKKDSAIHEKDHTKVLEAQKKAKKKAKADKVKAEKTAKTKASNKANATGKTGSAKKLTDPTTKKATKKTTASKATTSAPKPKKKSRAQEAVEAPVLKRNANHLEDNPKEIKQTIPKKAKAPKAEAVPQSQALEDVKKLDQAPSEERQTIDQMWAEKASKLMAKDPSKRKDKDIKRVAGELTEANDRLARFVVNKMADARGIGRSANIIGNKATRAEKVIRQDTGLYADMLQSARATMYETLHNVLAGSQNPGKDTAIGRHVVRRMRDKLHRDLYSMLNEMPAPHEMRNAMGDVRKAESSLTQELGRTPSHDELANYLQENSKAFREAVVPKPAKWDEKARDWVATKEQAKDPSERLALLSMYANQQKATTMDKNVGSEGERDVSLADGLSDRTASSVEETYEKKERQQELQGALPKAMRAVGLSDEEIQVMTIKHSDGSRTGSKPSLTDAEVAEELQAQGMDVTAKWVANRRASAEKKLAQAWTDRHPALVELYTMKSFVFSMILKAIYEYDLVKSLVSWGVDHSVLEQRFVRTETAVNTVELRKSLAPHEYVGSYVTTDEGYVVARIVEWALPETNELYKSFNMFTSGLQKSMFPHKGKNHEVNAKATEYVKNNAGKYKALANSQQERVKQKKGQLTWSEELLMKNPGTAWITWGGKKILIHGSTGEIKYDSSNEAHREDHNKGAQLDKIDFHHEKEALDEHESQAEKNAMEAWEKEGKNKKGNFRTAFLKQHRLTENEDGSVTFNRFADTSEGAHAIDHGIGAFNEEMTKLQGDWNKLHSDMKDANRHKGTNHYSEMDEKEREAYDNLSKEEQATATGKHILDKEGVKERLQKFHEDAKGASKEEQEKLAEELLNDLKGMDHGSMALVNKNIVTGKGKNLAGIAGELLKTDPSTEDGLEKIANRIGTSELARANEEVGKNLIAEGVYTIGNPQTGKSMVVKISHAFEGGRGGRGGKLAPVITEAFDPEGGNHEDLQSWGGLARALGFRNEKGNTADLKKLIIDKANSDSGSPLVKQLSEEEYLKSRSNTKLGLQESMLHKNFKLVNQARDKDGNILSQTFAQEMPDGTTNHIEVDPDGMIKDPLMRRLLNQRGNAIHNAEDLHNLMKNAVGNRKWVTAHFGSDIHVGDALGHHVQLEYDGKGAPRVVGGAYDGYRYMDQADVPKGAIDPATGEPIKALFKNGKLVDRRFSTMNEVEMKPGNAVMYPGADGKMKKGRIHSEGENGAFKVTDGKGHVIGMFSKDELQPAKEKGRMLSDSGQVVAKVAKQGTHRMNVNEVFKPASDKKRDIAKAEKAKALFEEALRKAKVNKAFDDEGNLRSDLELTDAMHRNLSKVLGRSKAGKELLKQFNSAYTPELEIHVPESQRANVEHYGVKVKADGTARISAGKFEELRDALGGLSMTHEAQEHLKDHFSRKDRTPKTREELEQNYQPFKVKDDGPNSFGSHYKAQFKPTYVSQETYTDKDGNERPGGLYSTQLQGLSHLIERQNAIAGHGMGTGKTILGVMAGLHYKATELANGRKPKKTLIVAPKGIMSDWGKEIGSHTNSKALYIGSGFKNSKTIDGKKHWGQDGTEQEVSDFRTFKKGVHNDGDHDFHIVSYDTFMRNRDHFANSGLYDNIAIDEVHAFKNQKGKRGKSLAETTGKFKNVWGLSGTPMENDAREVYNLVDTITGGKHELGTNKEFTEKFMKKDKNGKIVGIKNAEMAEKLGDVLANVVQFRGGEDVQYNDGSKIHFPSLAGQAPKEGEAPPRQDFIGNMVDRNRDHATTEYYGTKHSVTDFEEGEKDVTHPKSGESYKVKTYQPKNMDPSTAEMYQKYNELQQKYLPESKLNEMASASASGFDTGQKGSSNYLTAMQKLQKFLNAPLAHKMYVPGGNAIESNDTDAQSEDGKGSGGLKPYNPETGEGHYIVDGNGMKRYFESDGKGGFHKNPDGSPRLLPPLHEENPKAQYLKKRINQYLDSLHAENKARVSRGDRPLVPKVVVKSAYTTFGTDIVDRVLHDVRHTHPIFRDLHEHGHTDLGQGRFTGEAGDREQTKVGFRGKKNDYMNDQGNLWATTVSPAGKEGVDFGNAHVMFHFDQDWNPQKMAQFTARVRRSDSAKTHEQAGRANSVRVESLHMPGTVEDFMFNAQDTKMDSINQVTQNTRSAEKNPKLGDTESRQGYRSRGFTSRKRVKAKPKNPATVEKPNQSRTGGSIAPLPKGAVASADKAFKLVVLL